jgi:hypothetical protein
MPIRRHALMRSRSSLKVTWLGIVISPTPTASSRSMTPRRVFQLSWWPDAIVAFAHGAVDEVYALAHRGARGLGFVRPNMRDSRATYRAHATAGWDGALICARQPERYS